MDGPETNATTPYAPTPRRRTRVLAALAPALLWLAACSDDSSETDASPATEEPPVDTETEASANTAVSDVSDPDPVPEANDPPAILAAYLGAVDLPTILVARLEDVSGCEQQPLDEGMPIVLSHPVDVTTLDPVDFVVTTSGGNTATPTCATLEPATEDDELQTVLLTGPLGTAEDPPVQVAVVGELLATDGTDLTGLATDGLNSFEDGPGMVLARLYPAGEPCASLGSTHEIQTTWEGGVTGPRGAEPGAAELGGFALIDTSGQPHALLGFDDLGDSDNYLVVCVPPGVEPATLEVQPDTVYDPTNNPNPATAADVTVPPTPPR